MTLSLASSTRKKSLNSRTAAKKTNKKRYVSKNERNVKMFQSTTAGVVDGSPECLRGVPGGLGSLEDGSAEPTHARGSSACFQGSVAGLGVADAGM